MAKDDAAYPSYNGNPQKLDPAYTEGDDTVAGATDYNKHDDEILKHQDVINNTVFHTLNTVDGINIVAETSLTTLNLRTGAGISIVGDNTTKTITISSGEAHAHDALSKLDYASSGHTGFQATLSSGAGINIENNIISGTSDQNIFDTFNIEGTDIIANSLKTTLNFQTGSGISLSANNNTKTLTISGFGIESDPLAVLAIGSRMGATLQPQAFTEGIISSVIYLGPIDTDGTWKISVQDNNLIFARRESGVWISKGGIQP